MPGRRTSVRACGHQETHIASCDSGVLMGIRICSCLWEDNRLFVQQSRWYRLSHDLILLIPGNDLMEWVWLMVTHVSTFEYCMVRDWGLLLWNSASNAQPPSFIQQNYFGDTRNLWGRTAKSHWFSVSLTKMSTISRSMKLENLTDIWLWVFSWT